MPVRKKESTYKYWYLHRGTMFAVRDIADHIFRRVLMMMLELKHREKNNMIA